MTTAMDLFIQNNRAMYGRGLEPEPTPARRTVAASPVQKPARVTPSTSSTPTVQHEIAELEKRVAALENTLRPALATKLNMIRAQYDSLKNPKISYERFRCMPCVDREKMVGAAQ